MSHSIWTISASIIAGILLALCYPGFNFSFLVWVWMIPLLASLWLHKKEISRRKRLLRGFGLGYIAGLTFFLVNLSWLHHIHFAAGTLLPAFLALYFGAWGAFATSTGRPAFMHANTKEPYNVHSLHSLAMSQLEKSMRATKA